MSLLFISHSHADADLAGAVVELFNHALRPEEGELVCTSVDATLLGPTGLVDTSLRQQATEANVVLGLLTPASMRSAYVAFELGARWGSGKPLHLLVARGIGRRGLRGPLAARNPYDAGNPTQLIRTVESIAEQLHRQPQPSSAWIAQVQQVTQLATSAIVPRQELRRLCNSLTETNDFRLIANFIDEDDDPVAQLDTSTNRTSTSGVVITPSSLVWKNRETGELQRQTWAQVATLGIKAQQEPDQVVLGKNLFLNLDGADMDAITFAKLLRKIVALLPKT